MAGIPELDPVSVYGHPFSTRDSTWKFIVQEGELPVTEFNGNTIMLDKIPVSYNAVESTEEWFGTKSGCVWREDRKLFTVRQVQDFFKMFGYQRGDYIIQRVGTTRNIFREQLYAGQPLRAPYETTNAGDTCERHEHDVCKKPKICKNEENMIIDNDEVGIRKRKLEERITNACTCCLFHIKLQTE